MGMQTIGMPGGEILAAGQKGVINCAEFVGGLEDERLGFPTIWKYYYLNSLHEHSNTGDGILAALKIVEVMSIKRINSNSLFNLYKNYPQVKINIFYEKISKQKKKKILSISKNKQFLEKSIRTLIRFSGTEPLIRILVEGVDKKVVRNMANKIELEVRSKLD